MSAVRAAVGLLWERRGGAGDGNFCAITTMGRHMSAGLCVASDCHQGSWGWELEIPVEAPEAAGGVGREARDSPCAPNTV